MTEIWVWSTFCNEADWGKPK